VGREHQHPLVRRNGDHAGDPRRGLRRGALRVEDHRHHRHVLEAGARARGRQERQDRTRGPQGRQRQEVDGAGVQPAVLRHRHGQRRQGHQRRRQPRPRRSHDRHRRPDQPRQLRLLALAADARHEDHDRVRQPARVDGHHLQPVFEGRVRRAPGLVRLPPHRLRRLQAHADRQRALHLEEGKGRRRLEERGHGVHGRDGHLRR
jgi:hypothetical protein